MVLQFGPMGWQVLLELKLHWLIYGASKTRESCITWWILPCTFYKNYLPSRRTSSSGKWRFQFTQNAENTGTVTGQTSTFLTLLWFLLWEWDTDLPFLGPFGTHVSLGLISWRFFRHCKYFPGSTIKKGDTVGRVPTLHLGRCDFVPCSITRFLCGNRPSQALLQRAATVLIFTQFYTLKQRWNVTGLYTHNEVFGYHDKGVV